MLFSFSKKQAFSALLLISLASSQLFAQNRIAIVGGGMAGVATAHYLLKDDPTAKITVFEKNPILGGNAHTIETVNEQGKKLYIDAGPQYFADKSWETYIELLKEYDEYKSEDIYPFNASIVIKQDGKDKPNMVTPYKGNFRGESLGRLLDFNKVFSYGNDIFTGKTKDYPKTIGEWVNGLPYSDEFKNHTIIPFLAGNLGVKTEEIKKTSTYEMVKLFAFRKGLSAAKFKIMRIGMGNLIQNMGKKIGEKGVTFKTNTPIVAINYAGEEIRLTYSHGSHNHNENFDYVVIATHPYQAANLLKGDEHYADLLPTLYAFPYFDAHIVIHKYNEIVNPKYPAFFHMHIDEYTNMISNTMDLGYVNADYKGIYKSWVSPELHKIIKEKGLIIHEEVFKHPLITPEFSDYIVELKTLLKKHPRIYVAGGWTQGLETQETAILSGQEAANMYTKFKNS